jgi:hypothetical protein
VTAAEKEAHDKVVARKEQARVAASAAVEKVNQEIQSANDTAARNWSAVKAKVAADVNALKANVAQAKHDLGAKRAENYAEELEWEAGVAIDYAIASILSFPKIPSSPGLASWGRIIASFLAMLRPYRTSFAPETTVTSTRDCT